VHIIVVHQYYLHKDGAGGSRWNQFAKYWSRAGHKVTVLAGMLEIVTAKKFPEYKGRFIVTENDGPNIVVKRCHVSEAYNKSFIGRAWAYFSFTFSSILAGLFVKRPDVIICTSPPLTVGFVGWVLSRFKRIPMVFEVRDLWPESAIDTGVLTNKWLIKLSYWLEKKSYESANWINVLTPAFERALVEKKNIQPAKISMIPNGADLDIIQPGPLDNWVRRKHNLGTKFVVTYVGAHGVANALMQLVEAAKILKDKDPDVQIMLVGDGMQKTMLIEKAKAWELNNITFAEPVPKSQIGDYINASDVCTAVLKKCDTFKTVYPNKVFDYMSAEKPVIIGIDGVARALVENANAGLYAEPENPEAFVGAVEELKATPERGREFGTGAREFVAEHFSREALSRKYLKIIEGVESRYSSPNSIVPGCSRIKHEVFTLSRKLPDRVTAKVELSTKLLGLNELTSEHWRLLRGLQGRFTVLYLKWRYGSPQTYILLAYVDKTLVHIEWIVPARKIRFRYPFVTEDSYSIISCLTSQSFRGLGIYPSQIQKVVESDIPAKTFWIWTPSANAPSLKGICKAGGIKAAELVQKKWLWGCISHIEYFPKASDGEQREEQIVF